MGLWEMFYAVPTARVIITAKTSLDVFSLRRHVWTFSVLDDQIYEMRCPFVAMGLNADSGLTSFVLWSLLHHEYHVSRDHSHFQCLWYDWTKHQQRIEPTKPLGQCWVPPFVDFYDHQGLLRAYSLKKKAPNPDPRGVDICT